MKHLPARLVPQLLTQTTRAVLGEGPVWDDCGQRLYWVDIARGALHWCHADGSNEASIRVGQRISCLALRRDEPGFIAGVEGSIALLGVEPLQLQPLARLTPPTECLRCNDGKCDPDGRFWVGTYNESGTEATGWLYRYGPSGALARMAGPFICTNGPAFSPIGRAMYCVDTYGKSVHQYEMDATGELSPPKVFCAFDDPDSGYPDGLTCDAEGCVWIAQWGASRVSRFSPTGKLIATVELPVSQPTSCTFGGDGLRRLFITTASLGLEESNNANGLAGAVFAVDLEVCGLPAARYAG